MNLGLRWPARLRPAASMPRLGALGALALDVYDVEPPPADWPLFSAPTVVVSPHLRRRHPSDGHACGGHRRRDVADFVAGRTPEHIADPAALLSRWTAPGSAHQAPRRRPRRALRPPCSSRPWCSTTPAGARGRASHHRYLLPGMRAARSRTDSTKCWRPRSMVRRGSGPARRPCRSARSPYRPRRWRRTLDAEGYRRERGALERRSRPRGHRSMDSRNGVLEAAFRIVNGSRLGNLGLPHAILAAGPAPAIPPSSTASPRSRPAAAGSLRFRRHGRSRTARVGGNPAPWLDITTGTVSDNLLERYGLAELESLVPEVLGDDELTWPPSCPMSPSHSASLWGPGHAGRGPRGGSL